MSAPLDYYCAIDQYSCQREGLSVKTPSGETVPLDQCFWAQVAPCGCMNGILTAVVGDEVVMTAEQATLQMAGTAAEAKRDNKLGFRMLLITRADYSAHVLAEFQKPCPHDPKWGITPVTKTVTGVTFTRISPDRWSYDGGEVTKMGSWYLQPNDRSAGSLTYLARTLADALERAAAILNYPAKASS